MYSCGPFTILTDSGNLMKILKYMKHTWTCIICMDVFTTSHIVQTINLICWSQKHIHVLSIYLILSNKHLGGDSPDKS